MKKSMIRLLSLMLCLITLFSLLPMTVLAATTLGAPKNLTWNKAYDDQTPTLKTKYGSVCWQPTEPIIKNGVNWYEIALYKDNKQVHCQWVGYDYPSEDMYLTFDMSPFIEGGSGTYHFTVFAVAENGKYANSKTVKSGTWQYTQPDDKMTKPKNPEWDWPEMTWDKISSSSARYEVIMLYSPTKPDSIDEMGWMHHEWNINGNSNIPPYGDNGPGYYAFKVRTMSSDIRKNRHSSWVTSEIYHYKMDTPKAKHTAVKSSGKPKISWNAVEFAEEYEVYRATSKDGKYEKVTTTTSKSFTDKKAKAGKNYYYKVRAVTELGAKSSYSNVVNRYCDLAQPDVSGKNVSSSGKPKLSWDKVSGAEKYYVYRATSKSGEYKKIASTTSTSYTDKTAKAGKKYYYKVKAIHEKSSANSAYSEPLAKYCDLARPDVSIKLKNGNPKLSWDEVSGAKKYYVYRATSKSGDYEKIKSTTSTSFTDKDVKAGKTYYYKVKAIHSNTSANSAYSSPDKVNIPEKTGTQVWVPTNGGTKYHAKENCSSMENPEKVYLDEALERGFTACKKCY